MQYFQSDDLTKLKDELDTVRSKYEALLLQYVSFGFSQSRAREFADQGFARRLKILTRCVHRLFEILPPDCVEQPDSDTLADAAIHIQAFVLNTYGAIDNLAWIWVFEKKTSGPSGSSLPKSWVGLGMKNQYLRSLFSAEFQAYLATLDPWFEYLEGLRHAVAHRIPLYVPPHVVPESKKEAYLRIEVEKSDAMLKRDFERHDRLSEEQMKLVRFIPWLTHSALDGARTVVFHAQMLADFNTVEELGQKMLLEL